MCLERERDSRTSRGLLLAEALHALGGHIDDCEVSVRYGGGRRFLLWSRWWSSYSGRPLELLWASVRR